MWKVAHAPINDPTFMLMEAILIIFKESLKRHKIRRGLVWKKGLRE